MSHWSSIVLLYSLFTLEPQAADFSVSLMAAPLDALLMLALCKFNAWGGGGGRGGSPCLVTTPPLIRHYLSRSCLRLRIIILAFYGGSTRDSTLSFPFTSSLLHLLLLMQGPSTV